MWMCALFVDTAAAIDSSPCLISTAEIPKTFVPITYLITKNYLSLNVNILYTMEKFGFTSTDSFMECLVT